LSSFESLDLGGTLILVGKGRTSISKNKYNTYKVERKNRIIHKYNLTTYSNIRKVNGVRIYDIEFRFIILLYGNFFPLF